MLLPPGRAKLDGRLLHVPISTRFRSNAMGKFRRPLAGLLAAASLWFSGGCDVSSKSVDSSSTEATVKGVVKVNGAPATAGEIVFDPSNSSRPDATKRTAPIGKDGSYTIKTLTGENVVTLSGSVTKKNGALAYTKRATLVNPGENTFDFESGEAAAKK
jgi:hypothetical protein